MAVFDQNDSVLERLLKEKDARIEDLLKRLADKDVLVLQRSPGRQGLQNMANKDQVDDGSITIDVDEIAAPDRVSTSTCRWCKFHPTCMISL